MNDNVVTENGGTASSGDGRLVFSSNDFEPRLDEKTRFRQWCDVFNTNFANADFTWRGGGPFHARAEVLRFNDVVTGHMDYLFDEVSRSSRNMARDNRDNVVIGFTQASMLAHMGKNEVEAPAGSVLLYSKMHPVSFGGASGRMKGNMLVLPRASIAPIIPKLDDIIGRVLNPNDPSVTMLTRYVELLVNMPGGIESALMREHVRHTLVDLAALAIGAEGDVAFQANERGARTARLAAIKADVRESIGKRDISAQAVALRHGITDRYIRVLFEGEEKTFSEFVTAERLIRAYRLIMDPRRAGTRISEIAFAVGFADLSTFNRQFRRQYGMTPSEAREAALRN